MLSLVAVAYCTACGGSRAESTATAGHSHNPISPIDDTDTPSPPPEPEPELGPVPELGPEEAAEPEPGPEATAEPEPVPCVEAARASEQEIAQRLARLIWGASGETLLALLASGELSLATNEDVAKQAEAMLLDERARFGLTAFFSYWLELRAFQYSEYYLTAVPKETSVEQSARRSLEHLLFGPSSAESGLIGSLSALFTSREAVVDAAMAELYGMSPVDGLQQVTLPEERSAGLLTHAARLRGYSANTIFRGNTVRRQLFCQYIPDEPPALLETYMPASAKTDRESSENLLAHDDCKSCHRMMDAIGLVFDHFDSDGAYRDTDNGIPVVSDGALWLSSAADAVAPGTALSGPADLVNQILGPLLPRVTECLSLRATSYAMRTRYEDDGSEKTPHEVRVVPLWWHSDAPCGTEQAALSEGMDTDLYAWFLRLVQSPLFLGDHSAND